MRKKTNMVVLVAVTVLASCDAANDSPQTKMSENVIIAGTSKAVLAVESRSMFELGKASNDASVTTSHH